MIAVLMGVSGVGKTTIGRLLAARTRWNFEDADDYHSQENRRKMAAGIPLTDADRSPWLNTLHERMLQYSQKAENAIFACSALKQQYRALLAGALGPAEICFVYLQAPAAVIRERMKSRHHPYMNPTFLIANWRNWKCRATLGPSVLPGLPKRRSKRFLPACAKQG